MIKTSPTHNQFFLIRILTAVILVALAQIHGTAATAAAVTGSESDVPKMRVLVPEVWKKMQVEVEWGFDTTTADKDYSGRIEAYDGLLAGLRPLGGDSSTAATQMSSWRSVGKGAARRGVKFDLLYMGTSKWRKVQPFTSQQDDVARTIVTVWTRSGNFSFLAGDLEHGPILAPEYGF